MMAYERRTILTDGVNITCVITDFKCRDTAELFRTGRNRRFNGIRTVALRKLALLSAAQTLDFLRVPPGNRLEELKGDRQGQHSIRINDQWRICFVWDGQACKASGVEIVDYH